MGHPPEDDFVAGVQCVAFENAFGTTETPLTVKVVFENIIVCPPYPNPPQNGTYFLTQTADPCWWEVFYLRGFVIWSMNAGGFLLLQDNWMPRGVWFGAVGLLDNYINENTCPGFAGHQGTGVITWGPEIPKL